MAEANWTVPRITSDEGATYDQYNDVDDVVKHQIPVQVHYWFEVNLQRRNNEKSRPITMSNL
jgi:hypothetical protein